MLNQKLQPKKSILRKLEDGQIAGDAYDARAGSILPGDLSPNQPDSGLLNKLSAENQLIETEQEAKIK